MSFLATSWGLSETILNGLARDGGLYVPKHSLPKPTLGQMKRLVSLTYKHKAHIVLEKLIHHSQVKSNHVRSHHSAVGPESGSGGHSENCMLVKFQSKIT